MGVPANVPIYVPRMVAKHLEEVQKYHKFTYLEVPNDKWRTDDFTHQFSVSETHYRGIPSNRSLFMSIVLPPVGWGNACGYIHLDKTDHKKSV